MLLIIILVLVVALVALATLHIRRRVRRSVTPAVVADRRILFPYVAETLSHEALDPALRLAAVEHATLVPTLLVRVPHTVPLDAAPAQDPLCVKLQEAIKQRANSFGVPVDARVERGRSYRHALGQAITNERHDRLVIAAAHLSGHGIAPDDVRWLLDNAPGEIIVVRRAPEAGVARSLIPDPAAPAPPPMSAPIKKPTGRAASTSGSVLTPAHHGTRTPTR